MCVSTRQSPVGKKLELVIGRMAFWRPCLECECRCVIPPIGAPINDPVIGEVMPFRLLFDRHGFYLRVVPDKCPKLFGACLALRFEPVGNALRLAVPVSVRQVVEEIVVASKVPGYAPPFIVVALVLTRDRPSIN